MDDEVLRSGLSRRLAARAAEPYRRAGRYAWHFARGKLAGDPVFTAMLAEGLLPARVRGLDLGCGEGLLAAWLQAAVELHAAGDWPAAWPAPPILEDYRGIELQARDAARARCALSGSARIERSDIRCTELSPCNLVVILDVLHYISHDDQRALLARVRDCLEPGGVLLLRVGDAAGGLRFRVSLAVDWVVTRARGQSLGPLHCRPLAEWQAELRRLGLSMRVMPMSQGTPFANYLLVARRA